MTNEAAEPKLTYREAMAYLRENYGRSVCYATLRRWRAKGCRESLGVRLQAERFGSRWMTRGSWLDAFIRACNPPATETRPTVPRREISPADLKRAEESRRYLAAKGYGRGREKKMRGLPENGRAERTLQPMQPSAVALSDGEESGARRHTREVHVPQDEEGGVAEALLELLPVPSQ